MDRDELDRVERRMAETKAMRKRAEIPIVYLTNAYPDAQVFYEPGDNQGHGANAEGYGQKIATGFVVKLAGHSYRVYATHWANAPSFWVTINNQQFHLMSSELVSQVAG